MRYEIMRLMNDSFHLYVLDFPPPPPAKNNTLLSSCPAGIYSFGTSTRHLYPNPNRTFPKKEKKRRKKTLRINPIHPLNPAQRTIYLIPITSKRLPPRPPLLYISDQPPTQLPRQPPKPPQQIRPLNPFPLMPIRKMHRHRPHLHNRPPAQPSRQLNGEILLIVGREREVGAEIVAPDGDEVDLEAVRVDVPYTFPAALRGTADMGGRREGRGEGEGGVTP